MAEIPNDPKFSPEYQEAVKRLVWIHDHGTPAQWAAMCEILSLAHSTVFPGGPPKAERPSPTIPRRGPLHLAWSRPVE
jgi:hypothetical protein